LSQQGESAVRRAIMEYLDYKKGCYAFLVRNTAPNHQGKFTRTPYGFKKGVSDIICQRSFYRPYANGTAAQVIIKTYYIECKSPKGVHRPEQKEFMREIEKAGGAYILARSLEDVTKYI